MGLDQIYRGNLFPKNVAEVIETEVAWIWEENGIIISVSREAPRNEKNVAFAVKVMEKLAAGKKIYLLADMTRARPYEKAHMESLRKETARMIAALAIICNSPLSVMLANIMFRVKKNPFPVKKFREPEKAKEWLIACKNHREHRVFEIV